MKKLISLALGTSMILSIVVYAKDNVNSKKVVEDIKIEESIDIKSPFIKCKTMEEAEKIAGFKIALPNVFEKGYKLDLIEVIEGKLIQVTYKNTENTITLRKSKKDLELDIDYNWYDEAYEDNLLNKNIIFEGFGEKINRARWEEGDFEFTLLINQGGSGLIKEEVLKIIGIMEDKNIQVEDMESVGLFKKLKTMDEIEELAKFRLILPTNLPKDYEFDYMGLDDKIIEVVYRNKEKYVVFRKAKGVEDISKDANEYKNINKIKVDNMEITLKGNGDNISLAIWKDKDYTYAISVQYESWAPGFLSEKDMGVDQSIIESFISEIK